MNQEGKVAFGQEVRGRDLSAPIPESVCRSAPLYERSLRTDRFVD